MFTIEMYNGKELFDEFIGDKDDALVWLRGKRTWLDITCNVSFDNKVLGSNITRHGAFSSVLNS